MFPLKISLGVILMCCAYSVSENDIKIGVEAEVALLRMMALPPSGEGCEFLKSLMEERKSLYVNYCIVSDY